ncbi:hypothetical protein DPMN_148580 [Dreissena polymorpha]|uniref:Uncharacterized protein n=1 Tax=Dreissena polymorpha TaxID=45954 RepID=A0A9D4J1N6_DREPO|nr:hypothetical protein DPMN_148580 [Dreissena polymorpha]
MHSYLPLASVRKGAVTTPFLFRFVYTHQSVFTVAAISVTCFTRLVAAWRKECYLLLLFSFKIPYFPSQWVFEGRAHPTPNMHIITCFIN